MHTFSNAYEIFIVSFLYTFPPNFEKQIRMDDGFL